jgi:YtkA-like
MVCNRWFAAAVGVLLFVANLQANGCSKSASAPNDVVFNWESDPKPPHVGSNTLTIKLAGSRGEALAGAHVSLEGDMTHAGMSPAFSEAKEVAAGQYQGKLDLNMRGDWIVTFHITLTSGQTFDRQVKIQDLQVM